MIKLTVTINEQGDAIQSKRFVEANSATEYESLLARKFLDCMTKEMGEVSKSIGGGEVFKAVHTPFPVAMKGGA